VVGLAVVLLRVVSRAREVVIEQARDKMVGGHRQNRWPAHVELAPVVVGRPVDRFGGDLGLEDRRYRLRPARQATENPVELWGVQSRHLYHRDLDVAPVMEQFAA